MLRVELHRAEQRDLRLVVVLPAGDKTTEVLADVQRGEVATQVGVGATLLEVAAIGENSGGKRDEDAYSPGTAGVDSLEEEREREEER